jgi:plasmid stability protein
MPTMVQIRNVPDDLHRLLKTHAAQAGMSLSDFLLHEVRRLAERPSREELRERLARRTAVKPSISPSRAVRAVRDSR